MFLLTVCCCKLVVYMKVILRRRGWQRGDLHSTGYVWVCERTCALVSESVTISQCVRSLNELKYRPQMQRDTYLVYHPTCFTVVEFQHHIQYTVCYISSIILNILNSFTACTSWRTWRTCRRTRCASYNEAGVLSSAALPLCRDLKSEDILVCKPTENNLLHFGSAAVLKDQASNDTFGIPECLSAAAVLTEPSAKLCQLLGILLYPSGVKPASSRQSSSLHVE